MKISKILLLAVLFLVPILSVAQLQNFKASEGFTKAESDLKAANFPKPELLLVGSMKQTMSVPIIGNVDIKFNLNDGTSNAWIYVFRSGDNHDTLRAMAVVKISILGLQSQVVNVSSITSNGITIDKEKSLAGIQWKDSDIMAGILRNNTEFMTFYNSHPNLEKFAIALLVNTQFPYITMNEPYWAASMQQGTDIKACAVHAVSLATSCSNINFVENSDSYLNSEYSAEIFPNPSSEISVLDLNLTTSQYVNINISNIIGDFSLQLFSGTLGSGNYKLNIPVINLSSGLYLVKIQAGKELSTRKLIIK